MRRSVPSLDTQTLCRNYVEDVENLSRDPGVRSERFATGDHTGCNANQDRHRRYSNRQALQARPLGDAPGQR
jgi:hypothetical protein